MVSVGGGLELHEMSGWEEEKAEEGTAGGRGAFLPQQGPEELQPGIGGNGCSRHHFCLGSSRA